MKNGRVNISNPTGPKRGNTRPSKRRRYASEWRELNQDREKKEQKKIELLKVGNLMGAEHETVRGNDAARGTALKGH